MYWRLLIKKNKHWIVLVIACLISSSSIGILMNTIGLFNIPVSNAIGVSIGDFSFSATLSTLAMSLISLIMPFILKKLSLKVVVIISTIVSITSSILMANSSLLYQFYILGFIRGLFMAMLTMVTITILINNWFKKNHGLMTSIVFSFGDLAGAIVSPLLEYTIGLYGWQSAYYLTALLVFLLNLPAILIPISLDPKDEGLLPYGYEENTQSEKIKISSDQFNYLHFTFIAFVIISLLNTMISGMTPHLPAIGVISNFSLMQGATMLSACMIGNIVFKLLIGIISDIKGAVFANVSMMAINAFSLLLFIFSVNYWISMFASFLFGSIFATSAVGFAFLTRKFYPPEKFQKVTSITTFVAGLGQAFAMSLVGKVYDITGTFTLVFIIGIIFHILNIVLLSMVNYKESKKHLNY